MYNFSNIKIVLENPQSSKNVGSVCRAMKNMGFNRLYIAGTKEIKLEKAEVTAIHASDLLKTAVFCRSVKETLEGTILSVAVSRRRGKKRKYFSLLPEELSKKIIPLTGDDKEDIAIVFGNEVSGLNDEDLSLCNTVVRIPSSEAFPSLNLSHAVQIICYELHKQASKVSKQCGYKPINRESLDVLCKSITGNLKAIGFFKQVDDSDMRIFFRDIFARSGLSAREAQRMNEIFTKIYGLSKKDLLD